MSEWRKVQLRDIVSVLGDGLHGTPEYSEDGDYYFVNGNNLNEGSIIINQETQKVSYSEYLKYKKELSDRTLLVSINGTLGNVAYYKGEKVILGKSACYFNLLDNIDKSFIRYILFTPYFQKYIQSHANGTTIKNLSLKAMREFSFNLPPLQEQKRIADVLSCLDRKISNLRQQNETLEKIAQTLFRHWFVDFEFPNENGKPYKSSGGELVRSELGEIPAGWCVGIFEEFFNLFSGGTPKTSVSEYWNSDIKWLSGKDVTSHHKSFILETEKTISTSGLSNSAAKLLPRYTTIISARGTVGNYCMLSKSMAISQTNFGVIAKKEGQTFYGHLLIASLIEKLKGEAYGSVFDTITTSNFKRLHILIPSSNSLKHFETFISKVFSKILLNSKQIQTLTKTRDVLLPKLMSGKLRIAES